VKAAPFERSMSTRRQLHKMSTCRQLNKMSAEQNVGAPTIAQNVDLSTIACAGSKQSADEKQISCFT
jgi:hypothetical protein